jgi:hypothetical protein
MDGDAVLLAAARLNCEFRAIARCIRRGSAQSIAAYGRAIFLRCLARRSIRSAALFRFETPVSRCSDAIQLQPSRMLTRHIRAIAYGTTIHIAKRIALVYVQLQPLRIGKSICGSTTDTKRRTAAPHIAHGQTSNDSSNDMSAPRPF